MSWDHFEYPAYCRDCGHRGSIIHSENDWFQTRVEWIGFDFVEVPTKKAHTGTVSCLECGSSSIQIESGKVQRVRWDQFGTVGQAE